MLIMLMTMMSHDDELTHVDNELIVLSVEDVDNAVRHAKRRKLQELIT